MKSIHLIVDSKERVHSAENDKEKAESNARYLSISHASRPYRVVSLHFDGPLGFWSGHHLCEAAGIDLHGLRWDKAAQGQVRVLRAVRPPDEREFLIEFAAVSVRQAARARSPLGGADAQALEGALSMTERERDSARAEVERLRTEVLRYEQLSSSRPDEQSKPAWPADPWPSDDEEQTRMRAGRSFEP